MPTARRVRRWLGELVGGGTVAADSLNLEDMP